MSDVHPLLKAENLVKRYPPPHGSSRSEGWTALDGVSFEIGGGTTLALVGESGAGKSTLALCLAALERPTSGGIWLDGRELTALGERELRVVRPAIQMIFQDPASAMNHRLTAGEIIEEPLRIQLRGNRTERHERVRELLEGVGLPASSARRRLGEFSGGQRQRLAIARALALEPRLLILDEALSALDCSVQAQIANLLLDLQAASGVAYLFITHDLGMAAHMADRIAVMDRGRILECGAVEEIVHHPQHDRTRALLAALPRLGGDVPQETAS